MKRISIMTFVLVLSACVSQPIAKYAIVETNAATAGPPPKNYEQAVRFVVKRTFKDSDSIKDARLSTPVPFRTEDGIIWQVCLHANAKNSYGAYSGLKISTYKFRNGSILFDFDVNRLKLPHMECAPENYPVKWQEFKV